MPPGHQSDHQKSDWTTITVTPELRDRLREKKRGQESYSELLKRMLKDFEQSQEADA